MREDYADPRSFGAPRITPMRRQLPTLNIQSPCHESTSNMLDVEGGRHCFACNKKVVDLTEMSAAEAEALFIASGEDLCGEVRMKPSGVPAFRPATRALIAAGAAAAMMAQGCGSVPISSASTAAATEQSAPLNASVKQANVPEQASVEDDTAVIEIEAPTELSDNDDAGPADVDAGVPLPEYPRMRGRMMRR